ncbi:hypothetical protein FKM82_021937 [Ascaphus truei]
MCRNKRQTFVQNTPLCFIQKVCGDIEDHLLCDHPLCAPLVLESLGRNLVLPTTSPDRSPPTWSGNGGFGRGSVPCPKKGTAGVASGPSEWSMSLVLYVLPVLAARLDLV